MINRISPIRLADANDLQITIREIIPKTDGVATADMNVETSAMRLVVNEI